MKPARQGIEKAALEGAAFSHLIKKMISDLQGNLRHRRV